MLVPVSKPSTCKPCKLTGLTRSDSGLPWIHLGDAMFLCAFPRKVSATGTSSAAALQNQRPESDHQRPLNQQGMGRVLATGNWEEQQSLTEN